MSTDGPSEKDRAIWRAAETTQPEVALIVDGYAVISVHTLANYEANYGELIQLRRKVAELTKEQK